MSDERELKLQCLQLANGDVGRAREMFEWLGGTGELTALRNRIDEWQQDAACRIENYLALMNSGLIGEPAQVRVSLLMPTVAMLTSDMTGEYFEPTDEDGSPLPLCRIDLDEVLKKAAAALSYEDDPEHTDDKDLGDEEGGQSPAVEADWPTPPDAETTVADPLLTAFEDDHIVERAPIIDAQTCEQVDPRCSWNPNTGEGYFYRDPEAEPEIPEGFTKWEGGECPVDAETIVSHFWQWENGDICGPAEKRAGDLNWTGSLIDLVFKQTAPTIAYRIIEAPASEQADGVEIEPSPYAEAVEKGAITQDEADFLISERKRIAADEQAKFFAEGMMADADRHQSDQRSIVEKIGGVLGFKQKEPA